MDFVTTCPSNLTEKILASNRLGCENDIYGNNQYICAPNEAKTSLVEICNDGIMGIVEEAMHWILSKEPTTEDSPVVLIQELFQSKNFLDAECKESFLRLNMSLKKRLLSAYNLEKRASIQWGLAHEKTAIQEYCKVFEVNVLDTGIWLHESGVLGASPDGFVQGNPKNITERVHQQEKNSTLLSPDIVEVKCPFSARSMTIKEACLNVKDFFLGNCLRVAGTKYETVSCLHFSSGCPIHHYWSYDFYMHFACQKINTQLHCYEMDPACQLQVPDEVTENHNYMILGFAIAAALLAVVVVAVVFISVFRLKRGRCATYAKNIGTPKTDEVALDEQCIKEIESPAQKKT